MRMVLASAPVITRDTDFNVRTMAEVMREYSGKADLILFGESVLQGFDCLCWEYEKDRETAVALTDPPVQAMRKAARENALAVSFGLIERCGGELYSTQLLIGADGEIVNVFHRVSMGWKEVDKTDAHYREGERFEAFQYGGRRFAVGLCGDLWTDGRPEEMKALNADVVLWPVWCDYKAEEWNEEIRQEYAAQAGLCGRDVVLVNPFCADPGKKGRAAGGCAHFRNGTIAAQKPAGGCGALMIHLE